MQAEQQQRILGYFIEEAKDHLNTIEQGLLNLQSTIEDSELLYEVYRAAHSVKGGAAMLGLNSIQQTAHRLEDSFKILEKIQDKSDVRVDQQLESLFLQIFDTLQALIDSLSGPYGLTDEAAQTLLQEVEPVFDALKYHIGQLADQNDVTVTELTLPATHTTPPEAVELSARQQHQTAGDQEAKAFFFRNDVPDFLRQMLQQFKQSEDQQTQQALQDICQSLIRAGESFDLPNWVTFVKAVQEAIANPTYTYHELAPVLIKAIKQAQELVLENRDAEIVVSDSIQNLLPVPIPPAQAFVTEVAATETQTPESLETENPSLSLPLEEDEMMVPSGRQGPEIPTEELRSLADLFDGEDPIEDNWQGETLIESHATENGVVNSVDDLEPDFLDLFEQSTKPAKMKGGVQQSTAVEQEDRATDMGSFDDLLNIGRDPEHSQPIPSLDVSPETEEMSFEDLFTQLESPPEHSQSPSVTSESTAAIDDFYHELFDDYQAEAETPSNPNTAFEDLFNLDEDLDLEAASDPEQQPTATITSTMTSNPQSEQESTAADFADLDALLSEDNDLSSTPAEELDQVDDLFTNLDQLLNTADPLASHSDLEEDEFKELEKLLEDSPGNRGATARPSAKGRAPIYEPIAKVPVKQLDNLSNLMGELVVNRNSLEQDQERMRQFLDNLLDQVSLLSDVGQRMQDFYERSLLEISLLSNRHKQSPWSSAAAQESNRHEELEFESTELDRFTPFHTLSQEIIELVVRVRESAADIEFLVEEADQVSRQLRQVTTQLREGLTRARMEPFAQEADRLKRPVRDISIKCGKQAELYVEGRDTLIDKMLLGKLHDPLIHLVNNAITHGIEPPEVRQAAGKPTTGRITIKVFHQGNQTVIAVSDDGAGINVDKVKAKAMRKKLITPSQAQQISDLDIYDLLFHPGFSMKDQADEFAGRGVGMDVVRTSLMDVRGTITTDSALGQGTTFTIRLPLNMSISRALCCISDRARIAFPMDGVEDMIDVPKEDIQIGDKGQQMLEWRGSKLPFRHLRDLLTYNRHLGRGNVYGTNTDEDMISVIVLRSAGNYLAVQVDQVLVEQEIVIKQLEGPVPKPVGMAGATVLGDGQIVAIADVLELIDLAMGRIRRDSRNKIWQADDVLAESSLEHKSEPTVLIVDDSITVRSLLSITFEKSGYRVEEARDGKEAWEKLKSGLPCDLVFCDIEMPRMDGLELLSRMQKDQILMELPIAMLTSRGADRHRQMAYQLGARGYFTKPYLEEQLLEAAQRMLKGEVVGMPTSMGVEV